jgi:ParB family transcriptional regulator, chromosome partitioning protein
MAKPQPLGSRFGKNIKAIAQAHPQGVVEQTNSDREQPAEKTAQQKVAPSKIVPSIFQPRRYFDRESLLELQASIQQLGILEPLVVRAVAGKSDEYELIGGERRWRCAKELQLTSVPIVIVELSDEEAYLAALHDNSHREDLNPIDETEYILKLLGHWLKLEVEGVKSILYRLRNQKASGNVSTDGESEDDKSMEIVARVIGQVKKGLTPISFVETRLPLLKLPEEILAAIRTGEIEYTKAKSIAKVEDEERRADLLRSAVEERMPLSEIKKQVKILKDNPERQEADHADRESLQSRYKQISSRLQRSPIWENPKKQKSLEKLLAQIESLMED